MPAQTARERRERAERLTFRFNVRRRATLDGPRVPVSLRAGRNGRCRFALHASVRARSRFRFHLLRRFLPPCIGEQIANLLAAIFILLIIFAYAAGIRASSSLSSVNCAFILFSSSLFPPLFLPSFSFSPSPFSPLASPIATPHDPVPCSSPRGLVFRPGVRSRSRYCSARIARECSRLSADWLCQTFVGPLRGER